MPETPCHWIEPIVLRPELSEYLKTFKSSEEWLFLDEKAA
jgi:hypothetical protein